MTFQTQSAGPRQAGGPRKNRQALQDRAFRVITWASATLVVAVLLGILVSLVVDSLPTIRTFGLDFLWTARWSPAKDIYGAAAPIYGTIMTSVIAMVIGVPVSFGIAIFLTELCPAALRRPIGIAIELLAGIPSIIYGLWGFFVLAPFMQHVVQPFLIGTFGQRADHRHPVPRRALRHRHADRRASCWRS